MPQNEEKIEIKTASKVIPITIVRSSRAKRIALKSRPHKGDIALILPHDQPLSRGITFAQSKEKWLLSILEKMHYLAIPLIPDAVIPIRGVEHRLLSLSTIRGQVEALYRPGDDIPILKIPGGEAHFERRLKDWLYQEAKYDISEAVRFYAQKAGVKIHGITIRDTRSRWGSCSSQGRLNFSWRLIMAPPFVLRYLCAHEVAHRKEMNHSSHFWNVVRSLDPDYKKAEIWLKQNGSQLHMIG